MPTGISYGQYNVDSRPAYLYETDANHNTTDILKSVREQVRFLNSKTSIATYCYTQVLNI